MFKIKVIYLGRIIFLTLMIIAGFVIFCLGLNEVRRNSLGENFFDTIISLFLGIFEYSGVGTMLVGLLISLFCTAAIILGWGK